MDRVCGGSYVGLCVCESVCVSLPMCVCVSKEVCPCECVSLMCVCATLPSGGSDGYQSLSGDQEHGLSLPSPRRARTGPPSPWPLSLLPTLLWSGVLCVRDGRGGPQGSQGPATASEQGCTRRCWREVGRVCVCVCVNVSLWVSTCVA